MVNTVGDIGEALTTEGSDITEEVIFDDFAVETGNTVDLEAGGKTHIGHVDLTVTDDEVAADPFTCTELCDQIVAPAAVDFAHNLPDTGQQACHQILGPALQCFTHDGVVGVGYRGADNPPCLIPAEEIVIHKDAHELGDNQGGVSVVDLDDMMLCKGTDIAPAGNMLAHDILSRSGDKEVLLLQAQGFAFNMIVSGVKDLGDNFCHGPVFHAGHIFALREEVHIQRIDRVGIPETEGVDIIASITCDEHIAGDGSYSCITGVLCGIVTVIVPMRFDAPFKADFHRIFITGNQPAIHCGTPVVCNFGLSAVAEKLTENTELIADGISGARETERRHAFEIAGGETAETAVAEAGIRFRFKDIGGIPPHILQSACQSFRHTKIEGVFHEAAPEKELHGHVVNFLFMVVMLFDGQETAHQFTNNNSGCLEDLVIGRGFAGHAEDGTQLVLNDRADFIAGDVIVQWGALLNKKLESKMHTAQSVPYASWAEITGRLLYFRPLGNHDRQTLRAGDGKVGREGDIFIGNHIIEVSIVADNTVFHDDAVFQNSTLTDMHTGEDNAVFQRAFDDAVIGHQAVFGDGFRAVIGADAAFQLGADRTGGREEGIAVDRIEKIHVGGIISVHILNDTGIGAVNIGAHFSAFAQEHGDGILVEAIFIQSTATVHHAKEGVLIDNVAFQCRHAALRRTGAVKEDLHDIAVFSDNIAVVENIRLIVCADCRDFGIRRLMDTADFAEIDVGTEVADHQDNILFGDLLNIGGDSVESFDGAGVVTPMMGRKTERRQHAKPAGAAAHIPGLTGSKMIEKGLVVTLHDNAHIHNAGIAQRGEGKVNETVTAADRKGSGRTLCNKLTELGIGFVSKNDALIVIHRFRPPRPYRPWRRQALQRLL